MDEAAGASYRAPPTCSDGTPLVPACRERTSLDPRIRDIIETVSFRA